MKRILFLIAALFFLGHSFAQRSYDSRHGDRKAMINAKRVAKTTLVVILDKEMDSYNDLVKEAVGNYWKVSPVEYADIKETDKYIKDKEYSILTILKHSVEGDRKSEATKYSYAILLGNTRNKSIQDAELVSYIEIPSYEPKRGGVRVTKHDHLIPLFIKHLNWKISQLASDPSLDEDIDTHTIFYNDGYKKLGKKKVIIDASIYNDDISIKYLCKNFRIDENQLIVMEPHEIQQIIEDGDENYALIYHMRSMAYIYDMKDCAQLAYGSDTNYGLYRIIGFSASAVAFIIAGIVAL